MTRREHARFMVGLATGFAAAAALLVATGHNPALMAILAIACALYTVLTYPEEIR